MNQSVFGMCLCGIILLIAVRKTYESDFPDDIPLPRRSTRLQPSYNTKIKKARTNRDSYNRLWSQMRRSRRHKRQVGMDWYLENIASTSKVPQSDGDPLMRDTNPQNSVVASQSPSGYRGSTNGNQKPGDFELSFASDKYKILPQPVAEQKHQSYNNPSNPNTNMKEMEEEVLFNPNLRPNDQFFPPPPQPGFLPSRNNPFGGQGQPSPPFHPNRNIPPHMGPHPRPDFALRPVNVPYPRPPFSPQNPGNPYPPMIRDNLRYPPESIPGRDAIGSNQFQGMQENAEKGIVGDETANQDSKIEMPHLSIPHVGQESQVNPAVADQSSDTTYEYKQGIPQRNTDMGPPVNPEPPNFKGSGRPDYIPDVPLHSPFSPHFITNDQKESVQPGRLQPVANVEVTPVITRKVVTVDDWLVSPATILKQTTTTTKFLENEDVTYKIDFEPKPPGETDTDYEIPARIPDQRWQQEPKRKDGADESHLVEPLQPPLRPVAVPTPSTVPDFDGDIWKYYTVAYSVRPHFNPQGYYEGPTWNFEGPPQETDNNIDRPDNDYSSLKNEAQNKQYHRLEERREKIEKQSLSYKIRSSFESLIRLFSSSSCLYPSVRISILCNLFAIAVLNVIF